eukprot:COSAG02_NODE_1184_length_14008_cov_44.301963_2_plen_229_part_00
MTTGGRDAGGAAAWAVDSLVAGYRWLLGFIPPRFAARCLAVGTGAVRRHLGVGLLSSTPTQLNARQGAARGADNRPELTCSAACPPGRPSSCTCGSSPCVRGRAGGTLSVQRGRAWSDGSGSTLASHAAWRLGLKSAARGHLLTRCSGTAQSTPRRLARLSAGGGVGGTHRQACVRLQQLVSEGLSSRIAASCPAGGWKVGGRKKALRMICIGFIQQHTHTLQSGGQS